MRNLDEYTKGQQREIKDYLEKELCKGCPMTEYGLTDVNTGPHNLCEGLNCDDTLDDWLDENNPYELGIIEREESING